MAVITIMPRVARDLGGLNLYGWVFSTFTLGSLVGAVALAVTHRLPLHGPASAKRELAPELLATD